MDEINNNMNIPEEYKPISMWGYLGYTLLFAIPCVGFIVLLVFAFGNTKNINLKNWAKGHLLLIAAVFVIYLMMILLGVSLATLFGTSI